VIRTSIVLLAAAACATIVPAAAQGSPPLAGLDHSPDWTLDGGKGVPKAAHRKAKAPAKPAVSPEEADRAARLAEARRKFFENKPDKTPDTILDFGGYNGATMGDGALKPGVGLKF
jgi:hypothetical protein